MSRPQAKAPGSDGSGAVRRRRSDGSPRNGCSGKRRFASYDEAALALVEAKIQRTLRHRQGRREERSYWCGNCNGFHLTSQQRAA